MPTERIADDVTHDRTGSTHPAPAPRVSKFGLHRTERRLLLVAVDLIALNTALLLYLQTRDIAGLGLSASAPFGALLWLRPLWFLVPTALWLIVAQAFDAYRLQIARRYLRSAAAALKSVVVVLLLYVAIPYLTPTLPPSRRYWLILFGTTLGLLLAARGLYVLTLGRAVFRRPALIVGAGWAGQTIAQVLLESDDGTHRIVGFVDDDPEMLGRRVPTPVTGLGGAHVAPIDAQASRVLGTRNDLKSLVRRHGIRTLVLAVTDELDPELFRILTDCLELGVEIVPMSSLYERLTGRVPVEHVGGDWHLAMPLEHPGTGTLQPMLKRGFDILMASFGVLLLAPFVPLIALAIQLESPGPIFYTQARIGKGGRVFRVFTFRSMRRDAEEGDAVWSRAGDPRVTRVGKALRATHVDEFPQFVNILRGEMSAVGPRPERPEFLEQLAADIPFYAVRHAVKPGMAGWALVNCGYGSSVADALRKLQYDLYYIKHQSIPLDIVIILKTVLHSVGLEGR